MAEENMATTNPFAELGFDDPAKALEAFKALKSDLAKHKTRADTVTELETKLAALERAKQEREDAEKTELQKLNDRLTKMQAESEAAAAKAAKAERYAMMERGLSEHLAGVPEKLRPFASEHLRTILPGKEWSDPDTLKATITESFERFNTLLPEEMRVVPSGGAEQHRQQPQMQIPSGKTVTGFDFEAALKGGK